MGKIVFRGMVSIVGLAVLALLGGYFWLKSSVPSFSGTHTVAGLSDSISIVRDEHGFPHIFAQTREDGFVGLGFVHAQDRLSQLEFIRRVSQGRLAEMVGADGLDSDRMARTLNLAKVGRLSAERADEQTMRAFESYAAGINAYIEGHKGPWPPDFVVLGSEPSLWTASDLFTVAGVILLRMPDWNDELIYAALARQLDEAQLQEFFPPYPEDGPVTYSDAVIPPQTSAKLWRGTGEQKAGWPLKAKGFSSNTWVVHGSKTNSGKPLLASDPHGGLTAPTDYYLVRITGPNFELRGAGVPGFPGLMLGHNQDIAWGLTDILTDLADLFVEKTIGPNDYQGPDGPMPFSLRRELIKVKGGDEIQLNVRETRHGPVISDIHEDAAAHAKSLGEDYVVAVSMEALTRGLTLGQAVVRMNRARNWDEFVSALADFDFQQNFSYGDRRGTIGMASAARLPLRQFRHGRNPVEGWDPVNEWSDIVILSEILREKNPDAGFIANANNLLTPDGFPFEVSALPSPAFRIRRITDLIEAQDDHDLASMKKIQADVVSLAAADLLPHMTTITGSSERSVMALDLLRAWDGAMDQTRPEPLIYAAWLHELSKRIYADELGDVFADIFEARERFVFLVLSEKQHWCNDATNADRKTCKELLSISLDASLTALSEEFGDSIETWTWGDAHKAHFAHLIFGFIPVVSALSDSYVAVGGDGRTINNANVSFDDSDLFQATFGSRYRQIIDLSDLDKSQFMIAPGISENIFSPYYKHLVKPWANMDYVTLTGDANEVEERGTGRIDLIPN